MARIRGLAGIPHMALIGDRDRADRRAKESESLALSLAEALDELRLSASRVWHKYGHDENGEESDWLALRGKE